MCHFVGVTDEEEYLTHGLLNNIYWVVELAPAPYTHLQHPKAAGGIGLFAVDAGDSTDLLGGDRAVALHHLGSGREECLLVLLEGFDVEMVIH